MRWRRPCWSGALAVLAWLGAAAVGYGYGLGFAGTAGNVRDALATGRPSELALPVFVAIGVVGGAALAIRGPLRRPSCWRLARALRGTERPEAVAW